MRKGVSTFAIIGFTAGAFQTVQAADLPVLFPGNASNSASAKSWVGGVQAGYNWQNGLWVYGLEADISSLQLESRMNTLVSGIPANATSIADVDWYGTVRGRLGWALGPFLVYGTGGFVYGRLDLTSNISAKVGEDLSLQTSATKTGWVAGAGIEYALHPNLILNVGYQYVDLGTISVDGMNMARGGIKEESVEAQAHVSVVTVGLTWRFFAGEASEQWGGLYAGGHLGGAWGNGADASYHTLLAD